VDKPIFKLGIGREIASDKDDVQGHREAGFVQMKKLLISLLCTSLWKGYALPRSISGSHQPTPATETCQ
jgi:hypothetical protein